MVGRTQAADFLWRRGAGSGSHSSPLPMQAPTQYHPFGYWDRLVSGSGKPQPLKSWIAPFSSYRKWEVSGDQVL